MQSRQKRLFHVFFPLAHCAVSVLQSQKRGCTSKAAFPGSSVPLLLVSMVVLLTLYHNMGTKYTNYGKKNQSQLDSMSLPDMYPLKHFVFCAIGFLYLFVSINCTEFQRFPLHVALCPTN